jgi:hypothetical protein
MKQTLILSLALLALTSASAVEVSGRLYLDKNGNGSHDKGEPYLRGIAVSNGDTIVVTDRRGGYTLPVEENSSIFPILPAAYRFAGAGVQNVRFRYFQHAEARQTVDFGVVKQPVSDNFEMAAVGDVQFRDSTEAGYAARTFFSEAMNEHFDFALFLGDLVNDKCALLPLFAELAEQLPMPSWSLSGNHDRDTDSVRTVVEYQRQFGADSYAFNHGKVHFVVFNNVYTFHRRDYTGRLTERQLRFLRNDLARVPKDRLVVIAQHIPMAVTQNRDEVLALLEGRRCLFLSGHTHSTFRTRIAPDVQELTAGAVCGLLWTGEQDLDRVPLALEQCGTPRNYFRIAFEGRNYRFYYKALGCDASRQADVWLADGDPLDGRIRELAELPSRSVVVNVFAGGTDTEVRMRFDEGEWQTLTHCKMAAPTVLRSRQRYKEGYLQAKQVHRSPHRTAASPHIWIGEYPETLGRGAHTLTIEARDTTSDGALYFTDKRVVVLR